MRLTAAIQAGGYLLLAALIYIWLGIADRSVWQVLLSAVLGAAIVLGAVWLWGMALAAPARFRWARLPRFALWALAIAAVIAAAVWLAGLQERVGFSVASRLTLWLHRPVKPATAAALYAALVWIAGMAGVVALLPFASRAANQAAKSGGLPRARYWIGCAAVLAAGYWLPGLLLRWVPKFQGFGAQTASLIVRFTLAYAIAVAAWLALTALARRHASPSGRPLLPGTTDS